MINIIRLAPGVIAALAALALLFWKPPEKDNFLLVHPKKLILPLLLIAAVLITASFVRTIPAGHTGVVTTFGRVENYTLDSGLHMVAPWKSVIKMDNRVQKQTETLACFSSDIQEVAMAYTVNYQISKANAMTLYSTVGKDYYNTVISPNIAESVKIVTAHYTAESLVEKRDELAAKIETLLAAKLKPYSIEVSGTSIENMDFTDAFTDAVEAKQVAQQNKLRAETEAEQKKVEATAAADVRKLEADAAAYETTTKASAEAEANQKIAASLTPELIEYLYAQNWNGELPKITGNGSTILNAGDYFKEP